MHLNASPIKLHSVTVVKSFEELAHDLLFHFLQQLLLIQVTFLKADGDMFRRSALLTWYHRPRPLALAIAMSTRTLGPAPGGLPNEYRARAATKEGEPSDRPYLS